MSGILNAFVAGARAFVPYAPTIGTATVTGYTTASVTYTASTNTGGSPITSYTAVSSPGGITGTLATSGSGTINISGLSQGTAYTFTVYATNAVGNSASSAASNSVSTRYLASVVINANTTEYVASPAKVSGYVSGLTDVTFTINSGVYVGSTNKDNYAFIIGPYSYSWAAGDTITVVNNGYILGKGGFGGAGSYAYGSAGQNGIAGSPAVYAIRAATFTNNGTVGGGGGGGGGGGTDIIPSYPYFYTSGGGGGGGGAGYVAGTGGNANSGFDYNGTNGNNASTSVGGGGGTGGASRGNNGGYGGGLGESGQVGYSGSSTAGGSAGAGGACLVGKSYINSGSGIGGTTYGTQS